MKPVRKDWVEKLVNQQYKEIRTTAERHKFKDRFGKDISEYETFKTATEGLKTSTVYCYIKNLPGFFLFLDMDPDQAIEQRKKDITTDEEFFERKTAAYIKQFLDTGRTGAARLRRNRILGFFSNNGKRLALDLRNRARVPKGRRRKKYSPTNDEVRKLLSHADTARDKLIIILTYQSGALPIDISNLCNGDIPLTEWEYVERSRSKSGETWRIVTTPDIVQALKAYLTVRGNMTIGEPLFVGREGPLGNRGISQIVEGIIEKAGFSGNQGFVPKCLRDGFEDALVDAEIYKKVKEALMGHTADIENEYGSYNKMKQRLVEAVQKVYPLLCVNEYNLADGNPEKHLTPEMWDFINSLMSDLASGKKKIVDG